MPGDRSAVQDTKRSPGDADDPGHEDAVDPRREASPGAPLDHRSESPNAPTDPEPCVTVVARSIDKCRGQRR